jgi:hypothetical protein
MIIHGVAVVSRDVSLVGGGLVAGALIGRSRLMGMLGAGLSKLKSLVGLGKAEAAKLADEVKKDSGAGAPPAA